MVNPATNLSSVFWSTVFSLTPPPYTMLDEMMARFFVRTDFRDYCIQGPTNIVRGEGRKLVQEKLNLSLLP